MIFYMMIFCSKIRTQTPKSEEKTMTENQISYQNHEQEEEIDLVSLLFTVLRKYRQMLAVALACAVIFGAVAGIQTASNGAVSANAQEEYDAAMTEYEAKKKAYESAQEQYTQDVANNEKSQRDTEYAIKNAQEYAQDSLLNNLDPYNVWVAQVDLYVNTNYQIMPGATYQNPDRTGAVLSAYASLLRNDSTLSDIATQFGIQERYLRELVTITADTNTDLLTIVVQGGDSQTVTDILDALLAHMDTLNKAITASIGNHTISAITRSCCCTVSTQLRDAQKSNSDNLIALQTQINQLQQSRIQLDEDHDTAIKDWENTPEPVLQSTKLSSNIAKFALIGFVVGVFVVAGIVCVQFLAAGRVYSAKELKRTCGLPVLGALASEKSKTAQKLDAALNRAEGRPNGSTDAEMLCLMAETIRSRAPQARRVLVTGDLPAEQLTALAAALQATDALRSVTVTAAESILKAAATVQQVNLADSIVLAADCACSRYAAVNDQNEQIRRLGKSVLGCIVFE